MATRKTTDKTDVNQLKDVVPEEVTAEEINTLPDKMPDSAWDRYQEIVVPRKQKGEEQSYYICINDRRFSVPANGKVQKLPEPVAEILKQSLEAETEADEFADKVNKGELPGQIV